jgi:hypothetical protein
MIGFCLIAILLALLSAAVIGIAVFLSVAFESDIAE